MLGAGSIRGRDLLRALDHAPILVAADGGLRAALRHGLMPEAVIGDMDSLPPRLAARLPEGRLHRVGEQETTDFEKCLQRIDAPLVIGVGLTGRMDHSLAAFNTLTRERDRPVLILSPHDVAFLCPPELVIELPRGTRVSLFPLGPVRGESAGLEWPIGGLDFAADGRVGTSNRALGGPVRISVDAPRMLVLLPPARLQSVLSALAQAHAPAAR